MSTLRLGQGLRDRGWEIDTVSLTNAGDAQIEGLEPLTTVDSARPGRLNPAITRALVARIRELQPDVLVANGGLTLRYGALATRSTDVPLGLHRNRGAQILDQVRPVSLGQSLDAEASPGHPGGL